MKASFPVASLNATALTVSVQYVLSINFSSPRTSTAYLKYSLLPSVELPITRVSRTSNSPACTKIFDAIPTSPQATCINLRGLLQLASLSPSASVVPTVDSWFRGLCINEGSNNADGGTDKIKALAQNVADGCATDLISLGLDQGNIASIPDLVAKWYPYAVRVACSKNESYV